MTLILSLLDSPAFGGAEQYLLYQLYLLRKKTSNEVILATNNHAVAKRVREDGNKIKVIHLPYRLDAIGNWKGLVKFFLAAPYALIWFIHTLLKLSKKYSRITVYTPGFSDRMIFSPIVRLLGHRLIWLEFGPLQPLFKRNFGFPKLLYNLGRFFPHHVITISEYTKKALAATSFVPLHKITKVYPTTPRISEKELLTLRTKGVAWRKKLGLEKHAVITFVGRLASEKEVAFLIKAFALIRKKHPRAYLVIIGDGPERVAYEQLTARLKLTTSVLFTGFISEEEKKKILSTSTVFVFPSCWELEGFGMTTLEACMLGVPIVSSGHGPQQEIITHGETGIIFSPHTKKALSQALSVVIENPQHARAIAQQARSMALQWGNDDNLLYYFS